MGVGNSGINKLAKLLVEVLSDAEKSDLYSWAKACKAIQEGRGSAKMKFDDISKVTADHKALNNFFKLLWRNSKKTFWSDRSFVGKAVIICAAIGVGLGGLGGAGIVALGSGVGVPFFLVTAAGGAFIGALIKELSDLPVNESKKNDSSTDGEVISSRNDAPGKARDNEGKSDVSFDCGIKKNKPKVSGSKLKLLAQYASIKEKYNDYILLFQVGYYYDIYYEDAKQAEPILGFKIYERKSFKGVPICGGPVSGEAMYIRKLTGARHNVAICKEVDGVSDFHGIKTRAVVAIHEFKSLKLADKVTGIKELSDAEGVKPKKQALENDFVSHVRQTHPRAYCQWTDAEEAEVIRLFESKMTPAEIAKKFERQTSAIRARLSKLGLL